MNLSDRFIPWTYRLLVEIYIVRILQPSLKSNLFLLRFCRTHVTIIIIYKEMFLGCDWLIRVQLIPNITQNSAKICNTVQKSVTTVQKSVTTVQKSVTTVQKSVTTVQKSVISSLSDGIYSLKNQKYGGRIFTFA